MRELAHIIKIFLEELSGKNSLCSDTFMFDLAKQLKFKYFHNKADEQDTMMLSSEIIQLDTRFHQIPLKFSNTKFEFPTDAKFFRGCVTIST